MTAEVLLKRLTHAGVSVALDGEELCLRPGRLLDPQTVAELRARKPEIIAEIRKREVVLVAARLLRERRWVVEPPVCAFLIGRPGERCRRCGASWIEHYPAPADRSAIVTDDEARA